MINSDTYIGPSFSLKNRFVRVLWSIVHLIFFKYSPRPFHSWRSFLLRLFGAKIGKSVHIYPKVTISAPWNLIVQDEVGVADGVDLYNQGKIFLGYRAIVSQRSFLCSSTHDYTLKGHPLVISYIRIENLAWIASEAFIGPGVTVGEGAIVGARSAVFRDVDSWSIVGGNPARFIKIRTLNDA